MIKRTILGFIIAPLTVPICSILWGVMSLMILKEPRTPYIAIGISVGAYGYIVAIVCGVPTYLFYQSLKFESLWQYLLGGFVLGLIPAIIFSAVFDKIMPVYSYLNLAGTGTVSAMVFWLIVKWEPNKRLKFDARKARAS